MYMYSIHVKDMLDLKKKLKFTMTAVFLMCEKMDNSFLCCLE